MEPFQQICFIPKEYTIEVVPLSPSQNLMRRFHVKPGNFDNLVMYVHLIQCQYCRTINNCKLSPKWELKVLLILSLLWVIPSFKGQGRIKTMVCFTCVYIYLVKNGSLSNLDNLVTSNGFHSWWVETKLAANYSKSKAFKSIWNST